MERGEVRALGFGARARDWVAAVVTGQLAGAAMLVTMMLFAVAEGGRALDPLRAIGSIVHGDARLREGAEAVVGGLLLHQLGFTLFWSLVFGALTRDTDRRDAFAVTTLGFDDAYGTAVLGLLVGMASNLVDVVVVMPALAQGAEWTGFFLGIRSWVYHLAFGLGLATFPFVRARLFGRT
jgi:hypothetical protein